MARFKHLTYRIHYGIQGSKWQSLIFFVAVAIISLLYYRFPAEMIPYLGAIVAVLSAIFAPMFIDRFNQPILRISTNMIDNRIIENVMWYENIEDAIYRAKIMDFGLRPPGKKASVQRIKVENIGLSASKDCISTLRSSDIGDGEEFLVSWYREPYYKQLINIQGFTYIDTYGWDTQADGSIHFLLATEKGWNYTRTFKNVFSSKSKIECILRITSSNSVLIVKKIVISKTHDGLALSFKK